MCETNIQTESKQKLVSYYTAILTLTSN